MPLLAPAGLRRLTLVVTGAVLITSVVMPVRHATAAPTGYVEMSDGTLIAVNVRMPKDFKKGKSYPTVFEMSGYDGGSSDGTTPFGLVGEGSRGLTKMFEKNYATVHASVRGTGCSSGEFDLFSWRSALDGREVVEWIADQPWSNGEVGVYGHSYGGITGFMVAATRPPHLEAASLSGLIDDIYRGIVYPGGVSNYGFPLLWTGGVRNVYDIGGGTYPGLAAGDEQCAANLATHTRTVLNDPIVQGTADTDNTWFQVRSLINYAERIEVPIHIAGAFQDEQTGPRGPYHLFEAVDNAPARRLLMGNGDHGTQTSDFYQADRLEWMDYWLRGSGHRPEKSSVMTAFELVDNKPNGVKSSRTFPLEDTRWTDVYLDAEGKLNFAVPGKDGGSDVYFSGSPRQGWSYQAGHTAGAPFTTESAPDEVTYSSAAFKKPTAIAGPGTATLYVSSTAPDTELFVQLIDEAPDGSRYYIQRGMLKASHRAIDLSLSDRTEDGIIYRPFRPHTNPTSIEPGKVYRYLVEMFPVAHIFRPGHRLVVKIHTPPAVDSYYAYVPKRPAGLNTIFHDAEHPSSLMLPFVSLNGVKLGPAPKPCTLTAVRCVP
ncbi:MAG: CocE/NonD family hydrolase [Actinomycetota bacterium]